MLRTNERRGPARRIQGIRQGFLPRIWYTDKRLSAISRFNEAKTYIRNRGAPIVVKADGLAAGKGVVVARTFEEAEAAVDALLSRAIGSSRAEIVVEEFLEGEEVSFFALCDGAVAMPFASAHDHKRAGEGDKGPNTGGMGAYSPSPIVTSELSQRITREIVMPTLRGMNERGSPFRGVLFAGLIVDKHGPKVIEFNVRFGDPEAEVILPRLRMTCCPFSLRVRPELCGMNRRNSARMPRLRS